MKKCSKFGGLKRFAQGLKYEVWFTLEAQIPIYWVPVLKSLYKFTLSITQGPTIWVPGLLGLGFRKAY